MLPLVIVVAQNAFTAVVNASGPPHTPQGVTQVLLRAQPASRDKSKVHHLKELLRTVAYKQKILFFLQIIFNLKVM